MIVPAAVPLPYAEVAVAAPAALGGTFTYAIPLGMSIAAGQAVWAPFGAKTVQGIVLACTSAPGPVPPRPIAGPVAGQPPLTPAQLRLARWIAEYYRCTPFEAAALMMPPGFEQRMATWVSPLPAQFGMSLKTLTAEQRRVLGALHQHGRMDIERLRRLLNDGAIREDVAALERMGLVRVEGGLGPSRVSAHTERRLVLGKPPLPGPSPLRGKGRSGEDEDEDGGTGENAGEGEGLGERVDRDAPLAPARGKAGTGGRPKQAALLAALAAAGGTLSAAGLRDAGSSAAVAGGLVRRGLAHWEIVQTARDPLAGYETERQAPHALTPEQAAAWKEVRAALARVPYQSSPPPVFLLHGVTGSGKTEIYLRALAQMAAQGRRGLLLVPEIALTPQTVQRAAARFPGKVGLLHSALTIGEQYDTWWRTHRGEFTVVVGSRSAVFAPQPDLGVIILDEEHETSYKQHEPAPRYHAREVALRLAEATGAVVILGSATPDLGSYARALAGRYRLLELPSRVAAPYPPAPSPLRGEGESREGGGQAYGLRQPASLSLGASAGLAGGQLPAFRSSHSPFPTAEAGKGRVREGGRGDRLLAPVDIIDLRRELKEGNHTIFSRALHGALTAALDDNKQAVLFLNRRGASTFVQCRDCGLALTCRNCDVALTFHLAGEFMMCHLCNAMARVPEVCPQCGSARIKFLGLGTQRVEEEVRRRYPDARVLRWDRDAVRTRHDHEEVLRLFQEHQADILIGTQMVAKGLDLPRVTLVGVVNADINLFLPDFRAAERTFQLLTQVAGRAGRGPWAGRVIIQTYSPGHYAIAAAAGQDYAAFFARERVFRRQHGYPPYGRMVRLLFQHPGEGRARTEAETLAAQLRESARVAGIANVQVLGPTPAYPPRARGRYRWQIILLGSAPHALLDRAAPPRGWTVDVDPAGL